MAYPPLELYREKIGLGAIDFDPLQEKAALSLNRLYYELINECLKPKNAITKISNKFFVIF